MSKNVYDLITDRIINMLENNIILWKQPWSNSAILGEHRNLMTGHKYKGFNAFITSCQGYKDPYWITFNQCTSIGCHVRKGEKGTRIILWQFNKKENALGELKESAFMKTYTIFNVAQIDGLSDKLKALIEKNRDIPLEFSPINACENLVNGYSPGRGPTIVHKQQQAYYMPVADLVNMPVKESFSSAEKYYAILFHELAHSTGHGTRLARIGITDRSQFASHAYSKEELIAEMTSAFLCAHSGIDNTTIENSAAYIQNWLGALKGNSKMVIQAASAAQKAVDYITNKQEEKEEIEV